MNQTVDISDLFVRELNRKIPDYFDADEVLDAIRMRRPRTYHRWVAFRMKVAFFCHRNQRYWTSYNGTTRIKYSYSSGERMFRTRASVYL